MFENNPITGSRTDFGVDPFQSENLKYDYKIVQRILEVYKFDDYMAIKKDDYKALLNKESKKVIELEGLELSKVKKEELDEILKSNPDIEIKYIDRTLK